MAILRLKKQIDALDILKEHETQITRDFASLSQRRAQLVAQKSQMDADQDFDASDSAEVQRLITLIDSKFSEIQL